MTQPAQIDPFSDGYFNDPTGVYRWLREEAPVNYLAGCLIDVEQLVSVVDGVLRGGATLSVPSVTIAPRPVTPA